MATTGTVDSTATASRNGGMGVAAHLGMPSVSIDVDVQVENLRGLKSDLEEFYWSRAEQGSEARFALGIAIGQIAQRVSTLEEIIRHHGGDQVAVAGLTLEETRMVAHALDVLDGEFVVGPEGQQGQLWPRVRALLSAADDLLLVAARGQVVSDGANVAPRPCVVLPLVRSR